MFMLLISFILLIHAFDQKTKKIFDALINNSFLIVYLSILLFKKDKVIIVLEKFV
jgi:hypothetical protein